MRKRQARTILLGALIILIVLAQFPFFRPVKDITRRIIGYPAIALNHAGNSIKNSFQLVGSITGLAKENSQLKQTNTEQLAKLAELQTIQNENEQLKKDLGFSQSRRDLTLVPADVIGYSAADASQALTIDKGSSDGIAIDQAVISSGFLVGRVKVLSAHTAEVWLLANPNLLTPVVLTQSQTTGILKGGIRGLVVENIPVDAKVSVGESVVTSTLQGIYPSGIAVGSVEEIISLKEEIFVSVRISSPLSAGSLSTVFVVTEHK